MPIFVPMGYKDMPCQMGPLTEKQLLEIFKKHDANQDGQLDRAELKEAFRYLGALIPGWRAKRALHHADANRDGCISDGEWRDLVAYAVKLGYTLV